MAEETVAAPAPAGQEPAPAAAPAPAAPAAPAAEEPRGPLTREEARRGVRLDQSQRMAKADAIASLEEERAAEGAEEITPAPTPEPEAGEPAAEGEPVEGLEPGAEPEGAPEAEPETTGIKVELDPRHPGTQGLSEIWVKDEREARMVRTLVNGYSRREEVEQFKAQLQESENERLRERDWRLRQEAVSRVQQQFRSTAEYKAAVDEYDRIHNEIGPDAAKRYWDGVTSKLAEQSSAIYDETVKAERQADAVRRGDRWANMMYQRMTGPTGFAPDITGLPQFRDLFTGAIRAFDAEIIAGTKRDVTFENLEDEFKRYFNGRLLADPAVTRVIQARRAAQAQAQQSSAAQAEQAKRDRDAADKAAVDRYKRELADKREKVAPPHALGNLGATRERDTQGQPAEADATAGMTTHQLKRELKRGARQDAARRFGSGR